MIDRFLPAVLFLLFSPLLLHANGKLTPFSIILSLSFPFHPLSSPYISVSSSLFLTPPSPPSPPHASHFCTRSLFLGYCSPLARALLWSRPPSSCFLNPPAEWVSDWPRGRRGEREEEVTLLSLYVCANGGVGLREPPITVTSACLLSNLTDNNPGPTLF